MLKIGIVGDVSPAKQVFRPFPSDFSQLLSSQRAKSAVPNINSMFGQIQSINLCQLLLLR